MAEPTECPICLDELRAPVRTHCRHVFCAECFKSSLQQSANYYQRQCPVCRQVVSAFNTTDLESGEPLRRTEVTTVFGSVYFQGGNPGVASYHFNSLEDCYISYEAAPSTWLLADGTPPPARKYFQSTAYDEAGRTFRGTIDWGTNSFSGSSRWEYRMVFSESFGIICDGEIQQYAQAGELVRTNRFPHHLQYWREVQVGTIFGQIFVQGGRVGLASYHFDSPEECYLCYTAAPARWRLADGSAPPAWKRFESTSYDEATRTFRGTIDWGDNPFGGSARWEYEMVFEVDFSSISGGVVRSFRSGGEEEEPSHFASDLDYVRFAEEREELKLHLFSLLRLEE